MSADKKAAIISLVAETHIHAGVGQSTGALDLPVAREQTTYYPFIPGSGVKGAFRVWTSEQAGIDADKPEKKDKANINELFGPSIEDNGSDLYAGSLLCSDARLLLLPVRCLSDAYKWVTCPALLKRFERDCKRAGVPCVDLSAPVEPGKYLGAGADESWLGLEEREFERKGAVPSGIASEIEKIVGDDLKDQLAARLVVLSDTDFTWFARYALPVMTRNALDENKKVKDGHLWHEESLAPDTIMYVLLGQRKPGAIMSVTDKLLEAPYIQMGGNETVGQGWFKMIELGTSPAQKGENDGEK